EHVIGVWGMATGKKRAVLSDRRQGPELWVRSLAFGPDGKTLASARVNGQIRFWDVSRGQRTALVEGGHKFGARCLALSPDGKSLASGGVDQVGKGGKYPTLTHPAHADGDVQLWEVATGKIRATLKGHSHSVWTLAFSPDGNV